MSDLPQTIVCKAAVVMAPGQPFEIMEINVAPPKRGEVRVRILYACPCHTDEITQRGVDPTGKYPCILGHESCGEVESIGEGVITCKPGDKVIPLWEMCLLGCGVPTGMGAAMNTGKVEKGSTVAVYGLGCVGLACVEGAHLCGAKEIICVDINDHKLEVAKKFGGTKFINPKKFDKPIQEVIIDMTDGGVDYAFECTGSTKVMRSALESTCKGWGLAVIVGIGEAGKEISTRPYNFIVGRQLKGSVFGGWRSREDIPKLAQKVINGEIK
ncbi:alcohol dehydrogenase class III, putative [Eimeria acervulina]|uniref:Alcohol dehydrogenase class III, putative n=1 Tax=Eimeria acervulina TaxID=5801 RepID=U6GW68_EIMAC|nr:alcohol dehydrogenase class III, putative [Eimeria acervulina]CDI84435.1 alcohol dehydrogenase class III, putative [Eimeria acervulina]